MGNKDAGALYAEHHDTVVGIATNFAHRYRREVDEALSRANLIFMTLFHQFDASKGEFCVRLLHLLPLRLKETLRTDNSVIRYDTRVCDPDSFRFISTELAEPLLEEVPAPPLPEPFDFEDVENAVGKDAREVLSLLKNPPQELQNRPSKNRLRKYLRRQGWGSLRTAKAFKELQRVVA